MTPVHLLFLFGALPAIAYGDYLGLQWVRGRAHTLNETTLQRLHYWVYACLTGIIATGLIMVSHRTSLLTAPAFIMKMVFVGALVINSVLIGTHVTRTSSKPFALLSPRERILIIASGVVSAIAWAGAIIGGLLIG